MVKCFYHKENFTDLHVIASSSEDFVKIYQMMLEFGFLLIIPLFKRTNEKNFEPNYENNKLNSFSAISNFKIDFQKFKCFFDKSKKKYG